MDPKERPSAEQALAHPFFAVKFDEPDRGKGDGKTGHKEGSTSVSSGRYAEGPWSSKKD